MNIVIIGAGFTGIQLAKRLISEKNNVVLIDNNEDIVRHASNRLDCNVIHADGNNLETLEEAGIAKADALVTLTEDDEINMITCSLVDSVYPSLLKIARVRNYAYYTNTSRVAKNHAESFSGKKRPLYGIDYMIHPDVEAAKAIVSAVEHGAVSDVFTFGEKFELMALQIEEQSKLDGCPLKNLRTLTQSKFIVVFVETEEGSSLPSGDTILHAGNRIGILTENDNIDEMLKLSGAKIDAFRNITLVGAGRIGTIVANHILEKRSASFLKRLFESPAKKIAQNFVIVDSDKELCKEASEKFPSAKVLCGDITDEGLIQEEGLEKSDLVICATHNHEMNMVIAAYMESLGVAKTIALVAHSAFSDITRKLGVEVPIPLRDTIVDSIMSHLKGKNVKGIHTVSDGSFEIVECDLQESSKFNGKALKDIASPGEYLMLLVRKHGQLDYELPGGNTVLTAKDHLVLIEKAGDKKILEKFSGTV
ncbi:MAG: NAD-binding protein [Treponema sp.]|nr:NAD-binding protein [Treponema sp.]